MPPKLKAGMILQGAYDGVKTYAFIHSLDEDGAVIIFVDQLSTREVAAYSDYAYPEMIPLLGLEAERTVPVEEVPPEVYHTVLAVYQAGDPYKDREHLRKRAEAHAKEPAQ